MSEYDYSESDDWVWGYGAKQESSEYIIHISGGGDGVSPNGFEDWVIKRIGDELKYYIRHGGNIPDKEQKGQKIFTCPEGNYVSFQENNYEPREDEMDFEWLEDELEKTDFRFPSQIDNLIAINEDLAEKIKKLEEGMNIMGGLQQGIDIANKKLKEENEKLKEKNKIITGQYFKESEFNGDWRAMSKDEIIGYCEVMEQRYKKDLERKDESIAFWESKSEDKKDTINELKEENKMLKSHHTWWLKEGGMEKYEELKVEIAKLKISNTKIYELLKQEQESHSKTLNNVFKNFNLTQDHTKLAELHAMKFNKADSPEGHYRTLIGDWYLMCINEKLK
jgi:hypothetical protein